MWEDVPIVLVIEVPELINQSVADWRANTGRKVIAPEADLSYVVRIVLSL